MMPEEPGRRFSAEQMLSALRQPWAVIMGKEIPFDASTRIDHYMQTIRGMWEEVDFADVAFYLDKFFGLATRFSTWRKFEFDEWTRFLGTDGRYKDGATWEREVLSQFTFGSLAEFLARRVPPVSLEPMEILGRKCAAAGAFRAIEDVARRLGKGARRFAPSTPIGERYRGYGVSRLYHRVRWLSEERLPPLRRTWLDRLNAILLSRWGLIAGIAIGVSSAAVRAVLDVSERNIDRMLGNFAVANVAYLAAAIAVNVVSKRFVNPLPPEIRTFRDLATRMVEKA